MLAFFKALDLCLLIVTQECVLKTHKETCLNAEILKWNELPMLVTY